MKKRFFSLEDAREVLPQVKILAARMTVAAAGLDSRRAIVERFAELAATNSGGPEGTGYIQALIRLHGCVKQLQNIGCLVKGVEEGLIDFPHMRDGREVYLCWKHGEQDIRYWHETDSGFAGRTPIVESSGS